MTGRTPRSARPSRDDLIPRRAAPGASIPVDRHALYAAFGRKDRWTLPAGAGIVCASDAHAFPGLRLMLASVLLSHDARVTVFDLGMRPDQLAWLRRQPVDVRTPKLPEGHKFHAGQNRWTLWVKPLLMLQSPYEASLWLDSDLIVRRDLANLLIMASRDDVIYFPDTFAKPSILLNKPALYERYPVPEVFPTVNSGVVAFAKGHPTIARAADLLGEVISGDLPREWISGWDQGLFKLAWEEAGIPPVDDPSWNRPGWSLAEMGTTLDAPALLARCRPGEITHFQSEPKPWARWADTPLSLREAPSLRVLILGHEPFHRPERTWLTNVNLTDHDPDQSWGECRVYDLPIVAEIDAEYIGLASFSWVQKYDKSGILAPWEFGELELKPNRVWCAQRTDDRRFLPQYTDWADHVEHFNPGVKVLIEELRALSGRVETHPAAWSNNWILHADLFRELTAFYRHWMAYFRAKYPTCPYRALVPAKEWGYCAEAIGVQFLASQPGLEFVEMKAVAEPPKRPTVAESRAMIARVNACPSRGCKVGCHTSACSRFGKPVSMAECKACPHLPAPIGG